MVIIHISHPYGQVDRPAPTFLDYVRNETYSHCGIQPLWEGELAERLGLVVRIVSIEDWHGWLEVQISGHWEGFDATTNTCLSETAQGLLNGSQRYYCGFFTDQYDSLSLRGEELAIGLTWHPEGQLTISELSTVF